MRFVGSLGEYAIVVVLIKSTRAFTCIREYEELILTVVGFRSLKIYSTSIAALEYI